MQQRHPSHHHFACITLSNLIKRVVFKHHLAQLLIQLRVGEEEPRLGSLGGGESISLHRAAAVGERGRWAAPTIPKARTQLENCRQPGTFLLRESQSEIKKAQSGVLQSRKSPLYSCLVNI